MGEKSELPDAAAFVFEAWLCNFFATLAKSSSAWVMAVYCFWLSRTDWVVSRDAVLLVTVMGLDRRCAFRFFSGLEFCQIQIKKPMSARQSAP